MDQVLNAPELVYRYGAHVQELQRRQREAEFRRNEANKAALARLFPQSGVFRRSDAYLRQRAPAQSIHEFRAHPGAKP